MKTTEWYCVKHPKIGFWHIYNHPKVVSFIEDPKDIIKVKVREAKEGEEPNLYAWYDNDDQDIDLLFAHHTHFSMCFPYGYKAEEEANKGRVVRLVAEMVEGWKYEQG